MAQKTKARQKPTPRSRGSTSKASKSRAAKPRNTNAGTSRSRNRSKATANGAGRIDAARHTVEETAKDAGHAVGGAVSKAKVPLVAGGAALAGAAGGLVLGARARRHGVGARVLSRRPQVKVRSQDLAKAAKEVGSFGAQMGRLATELQQAREAAAGNGKHRSPVEVVLEGLTARRSHS